MAKAAKRTAGEIKACNDACARAYREHKNTVQAMVARLAKAADEEFEATFAGVREGELHYGHVGNLGRVQQLLRELSDVVFSEGEYALERRASTSPRRF